MNYNLQFGQIAADIPYILSGAWPTLWITFVTFFLASSLGLFVAMARLKGGVVASRLAGLWVTLTTNSPLFVVLFFLFNGLPEWGILLSPIAATLIAFIAISVPIRLTHTPTICSRKPWTCWIGQNWGFRSHFRSSRSCFRMTRLAQVFLRRPDGQTALPAPIARRPENHPGSSRVRLS